MFAPKSRPTARSSASIPDNKLRDDHGPASGKKSRKMPKLSTIEGWKKEESLFYYLTRDSKPDLKRPDVNYLPWWHFDAEHKMLYCDLCKEFQHKINVDSRALIDGSSRVMKQTLLDHAKSQQHIDAIKQKSL